MGVDTEGVTLSLSKGLFNVKSKQQSEMVAAFLFGDLNVFLRQSIVHAYLAGLEKLRTGFPFRRLKINGRVGQFVDG